jgi:hypothetical protein
MGGIPQRRWGRWNFQSKIAGFPGLEWEIVGRTIGPPVEAACRAGASGIAAAGSGILG